MDMTSSRPVTRLRRNEPIVARQHDRAVISIQREPLKVCVGMVWGNRPQPLPVDWPGIPHSFMWCSRITFRPTHGTRESSDRLAGDVVEPVTWHPNCTAVCPCITSHEKGNLCRAKTRPIIRCQKSLFDHRAMGVFNRTGLPGPHVEPGRSRHRLRRSRGTAQGDAQRARSLYRSALEPRTLRSTSPWQWVSPRMGTRAGERDPQMKGAKPA